MRPQAGRKALVLRTITALAGEEPRNERVAKANGFSLHAGVSCEAHQRQLRERLCRYIARPAVAEQRLTVNAQGKVVYLLKTPYRDGTTHVVFEPRPMFERTPAEITAALDPVLLEHRDRIMRQYFKLPLEL